MRALTAIAAIAAALAAPPIGPDEVLILDEEFSGTRINMSLWKHEITLSGEGNWEFEYYLNNRTNSFISNGSLVILPTLLADTIGLPNVENGFTLDINGGDPSSYCTSAGSYGCLRTSGAGGNYLNPVQSVRLRTAETFAFKYGRVEFNAKLPLGDWQWPALWLMPSRAEYGGWPVSGEIDVMESRGNARGYPAGGVESFGSTLHWGPNWSMDRYTQTHAAYSLPSGDFSDAFHIFGLYWNETRLQTYLDTPDNVILDVDMSTQSFWQAGGFANATGPNFLNPWMDQPNNAPFDQRFYLIIDLAIGGTNGYFPDGMGGKPWSDTDPHAINAFADASGAWLPTWASRTPGGGFAGSPFMIDSVKVWQAPSQGGDYAFQLMI